MKRLAGMLDGRDIAAAAGLLLLAAGVGLAAGAPFALIVVGAFLLTLALWGSR